MHRYRAYGLSVASNEPIPQLRPETHDAPPDVVIDFVGDEPQRCSVANERLVYPLDPNEGSFFQVWRTAGGGVRISAAYGDEYAAFELDPTASLVTVAWSAGSPLQDVLLYLLGPVFGAILRLRRTVCLHGSALVMGGRAVVLIGPKSSGKSTTTTALLGRGHALLSDDITGLDFLEQEVQVRSGYPGVRLRPGSVNHLFGDVEALPRLWSDAEGRQQLDRRFLSLDDREAAFHSEPAPLSAVYVLTPWVQIGSPHLEILDPMNGLLALAANTFVDYLLEKEDRIREWKSLSRLLRDVRVGRIIRPFHLDALDRVCRLIEEDMAHSVVS